MPRDRLAQIAARARTVGGRSFAHNLPLYASAIAFGSFLALPSALLLVTGFFSLVAEPTATNDLIARLDGVMPPQVVSLLGESLERVQSQPGSGGVLAIAGGLLALWSTSGAMMNVMSGLSMISGVPDARSFVRKRAAAAAMVAVGVVAFLLVCTLLVLGPVLSGLVGDALGSRQLVRTVWWTAQWPLLIVALWGAFALLVRIGIDGPPLRAPVVGGAVAVALWLAASGGLAIYAANFGSYDAVWGSLSAVIVTMTWLWLSALSLLVGAEVEATSPTKI